MTEVIGRVEFKHSSSAFICNEKLEEDAKPWNLRTSTDNLATYSADVVLLPIKVSKEPQSPSTNCESITVETVDNDEKWTEISTETDVTSGVVSNLNINYGTKISFTLTHNQIITFKWTLKEMTIKYNWKWMDGDLEGDDAQTLDDVVNILINEYGVDESFLIDLSAISGEYSIYNRQDLINILRNYTEDAIMNNEEGYALGPDNEIINIVCTINF